VELVWRDSKSQYTVGESGWLGKFKVFSIHYNSTRSKSNTDDIWQVACLLPGIKDDLGCFKTIEEAKDIAQRVMDIWIEGTGLSSPQPILSTEQPNEQKGSEATNE